MNFKSVTPEENEKFAALCLRIIDTAERTRDVQSQGSLDVVQAIKILDTSKINEVAVSAYVSGWQIVGGKQPAKIIEILDGLADFSGEVSSAIILLETSIDSLEALGKEFDKLDEYSMTPEAGETARQVVSSFLNQSVESVRNHCGLLCRYRDTLKLILKKLPSIQKIYSSKTPSEMVSNVLIAAAEMEKIDAEFAEEDESDDQEEVNAEETASNIRKAVRMMSQQFKKK